MTERHRSGVLAVEKGPGVTSFQVVAHLRRVLRAQRIGHGGTLDPDATGVLPILIGEATKLTPYLIDLDKEYVATVRLGVATTTEDMTGDVLETRPVPQLDTDAIQRALARFVGTVDQVPPMYSALRHRGRRLYELAREGRHVERAPRQVEIHAISLERIDLPDVTIRVRCGKGTYIRTLAADLGTALGCGAALGALVRTRVGPYSLANAVSWETVRETRHGEPLWARVEPCDSALHWMPRVSLDSTATAKFVHGQTVGWPGAADGLVRVYGADGTLLGVGRAQQNVVKPERLLHADPPRPRILPA